MMKPGKLIIGIVFLTIAISCSKQNNNAQVIVIPNGDFEDWGGGPLPSSWQTNSCPHCVPPFETYVVQQDSNAAYHGKYAAKFIYNNVFAAFARNRFPVPDHPSMLKAFVKCNMFGADTVFIKIVLFSHATVVDSGQWVGLASINDYTQVSIPITQHASKVDTAMISIQGGLKISYPNSDTEFWVDDLTLQ